MIRRGRASLARFGVLNDACIRAIWTSDCVYKAESWLRRLGGSRARGKRVDDHVQYKRPPVLTYDEARGVEEREIPTRIGTRGVRPTC